MEIFSTLSSADLSTAMNLLFGTNGCRFVYGRIPIGASDYAIARYTDDEISSGTDYNMTSFSITEDQKYLIPYVKAALAINPNIHFWGSPWTPPTWMIAGSRSIEAGSHCCLVRGSRAASRCQHCGLSAHAVSRRVQAQREIAHVCVP